MRPHIQQSITLPKLSGRKEQNMATASRPPASRVLFIDIARIYGVVLVYYGHIIESYMKAGSAVAAMHYKFVYSFHMPLFFILSGYIAKEQLADTEFGSLSEKARCITPGSLPVSLDAFDYPDILDN